MDRAGLSKLLRIEVRKFTVKPKYPGVLFCCLGDTILLHSKSIKRICSERVLIIAHGYFLQNIDGFSGWEKILQNT